MNRFDSIAMIFTFLCTIIFGHVLDIIAQQQQQQQQNGWNKMVAQLIQNVIREGVKKNKKKKQNQTKDFSKEHMPMCYMLFDIFALFSSISNTFFSVYRNLIARLNQRWFHRLNEDNFRSQHRYLIDAYTLRNWYLVNYNFDLMGYIIIILDNFHWSTEVGTLRYSIHAIITRWYPVFRSDHHYPFTTNNILIAHRFMNENCDGGREKSFPCTARWLVNVNIITYQSSVCCSRQRQVDAQSFNVHCNC